MAILAECPVCHRKQTIRNRTCKCGTNLDAEKKSKKVLYHIVYRMNGKQIWKSLSSFVGVNPHSIEDARAVESKFLVCKRENKLEVFEVKKDAKTTFRELSEWYLALPSIKKLASYDRVRGLIGNFNKEFGERKASSIKPLELES